MNITIDVSHIKVFIGPLYPYIKISDRARDRVIIFTNLPLPCPCYPENKLEFSFYVNDGKEYCEKNFTGVPIEVLVETRKLHCGWVQFIDGGEAVKKDGEMVCPKCGQTVHVRGWAV